MSRSAIGAQVQFCGHDGTFIADIFEIDGVNVVRSPVPVNGGMLKRPAVATHTMEDFPRAGFWRPDIGVFVVPAAQVKEVRRRK